jgi:hypothetical protein
MQTVAQFQTASDFWNNMVVPDHSEFQANAGDLRIAFHAASSLFHMHDWVFSSYQASVCSSFTFIDGNGTQHPVNNAATFANSLEAICPDFALVRGIANAAKHLALTNIRPHPDAPSHAANTTSQSVGWGEGAYGVGPYDAPQVMLQGSASQLHFIQIADNVKQMWAGLNCTHNWW